ncbi:alpha/beta fold hydrolase [Ramlibacter pallidus]|uniref:Alpha/beta hydrolase n=1 Tax=Ramlibacter pallidus TaxID=2780087 RepID=A0ABR9S2S1_9BURK|nr:alpha/beta hydrolase [Ramlibacter pallidus]MBE7367791.1 alpha/beta hydrolase [Ramlibacter pallidus]
MQDDGGGPIGVLPPIQALQTRSGRLSFTVSGTGTPSIVLFSGAGVSLQGWQSLYPVIEQLGTVFAWNRFGMQGSDAPGDRQSGTVVIASLRELLGYAGVEPPYVLVAHSLGGLFANLFARLHPGEVAGVLLLEATHPDDPEALQKNAEHMVKALGKLLELPELFFRANVESELAAAEEIAREIAAAGPFPPVPLRVVTGGLTPRAAQVSPAVAGAKRAHQDELARLSPLGEQVIAQQSGHFPQMSEPALVLQVLRDLLEQARAPA